MPGSLVGVLFDATDPVTETEPESLLTFRGGSGDDARRRVRVIRPLRDFLVTESGSGILLLGAAVIALFWANSPWRASYDALWNTRAGLRFGSFDVMLDLRHWVDDGLMTIFFFVVGLEIKRELVEGELRDRRRAALPAIAALGGVTVPALVFAALNASGRGRNGWGVPMATDIAMTLAVLGIAAPRSHPSLKLFVLTLAIVDDLLAIAVIAIFYASHVRIGMVGAAIGLLAAVVVAQRCGARHIGLYAVLGIGIWSCTQRSGIHATVAGVALAFLAPTRPRRTVELVDEDELLDLSSTDAVRRTMALARDTVSVVEWLEHVLHPWSSFVILPVFAFANAGIRFDAASVRAATSSRIALGVLLGLVIGKVVGITLAVEIALRTKVADLPRGLTRSDVRALSVLCGVGFTVAIFIASLAFDDTARQNEAKIGIVAASIVAMVAGGLVVRRTSNEPLERPPAVEQ